MVDVITTQIGALPAAEDVDPDATFLAIQAGPNGTPLQKATPTQIMKGIVDSIGSGTIVAGAVVITSGTAILSNTTTGTLTADTVTIKAGTGTLSAAAITALTATTGTIATGSLGSLAVSGAASLAGMTATTGSYSGTLTAAGSGTGLAVTNNATVGGTLKITGATTLAAASATALTAATLATSGAVTVGDSLAVTGKTTLAVVDTSNLTANGVITGKAAGTGLAITNDGSIGGGLKVGGSTTLAAVSGSSMAISGSVSAGTISVTGTATALAVTNSASVGGALGVSGAMTAGSVIGASGTITSLNSGTVAVSGLATVGSVVATAATAGALTIGGDVASAADTRWGLLGDVRLEKDGSPISYFGPDGTRHEGVVSANSIIATTGDMTTAAVTGTLTAGTTETDVLIAGGGSVTLDTANISDATITDATIPTINIGGDTIAAADSRWGLFGGISFDKDGAPIGFGSTDGTHAVGALTANYLTLGNEPTNSSHAATKKYVDETSGGTSGVYTGTELDARDALALAQSMAVRDQTNTTLAGAPWKYSHIIHYGQSFALGFGATLVTKTAGPDGTWSYGARPGNTVDTDVFTQSGAAAFADLTITAGTEVPAIGMANHFRRSQLQSLRVVSDTTRQIVVNAAGKGGTALEDLSKGASPTEHYAQITDLIAKSVTAAGSDPYGVSAVCLLQGESNYSNGAKENTEAGYKALLETFASDVVADAKSATGQVYDPAVMLIQTSSVWDSAAGDVSAIGNAQLSASLDNPGIYLVGPYYAYPDDGTNHPTADGYRWIGEQFAKVANKVLVNGAGWKPCHIAGAYFRADKILLEIHTPEPPLQVQQVYAETTLTSYTNHGFRVGDDGGSVTISSIEVNRSTIVLTMARDLLAADNPWIQYAGEATFDGGGNICDSDPTIAYHTSSLTSLPYPLYNWLCGQRIDLIEDV